MPLAPRRGWPGRCGKLLYMAPELFDCRASFDDFAADVWALGIILFFLLTGMPAVGRGDGAGRDGPAVRLRARRAAARPC